MRNGITRVSGINYPWTVIDGKPNYGCDFGVNIWRSHAGVSAHLEDVRRDFEAMAAIGVEIVRWFVFTDGRGGVRWSPDGRVDGFADRFFDDMDAALGIARETGLDLCLVLFDYSWMLHREEFDARGERLFVTRPEMLATPAGIAAVLEHLIDPFFARYGTAGSHGELGRAIRMVDVINEPDWVTRELAPDRSRDAVSGARRLQRPFSLPELRACVGAVSERVHHHTSALVTVGGGRARFAAEWENPAYDLDVVQIHSYPDPHHPDRDRSIVGRPASALGLSKPVLIGEFPASSLADYLNLARDGGYAGAWPWSFKGVDEIGAVDAAAMQAWLAATPPSR
jgi:hypothetical protein